MTRARRRLTWLLPVLSLCFCPGMTWLFPAGMLFLGSRPTTGQELAPGCSRVVPAVLDEIDPGPPFAVNFQVNHYHRVGVLSDSPIKQTRAKTETGVKRALAFHKPDMQSEPVTPFDTLTNNT